MYGSIANSYNRGNISINLSGSSSDVSCIGGIVGYIHSARPVYYVLNTGNILFEGTGNGSIGGVIGSGWYSQFQAAYSIGQFEVTGNSKGPLGGVAGTAWFGDTSQCTGGYAEGTASAAIRIWTYILNREYGFNYR